jgi:K+-transporting ATPase ATPase B chain
MWKNNGRPAPRLLEVALKGLVYGVGGVIIPFIGIKAIDLCLVALHLA